MTTLLRTTLNDSKIIYIFYQLTDVVKYNEDLANEDGLKKKIEI